MKYKIKNFFLQLMTSYAWTVSLTLLTIYTLAQADANFETKLNEAFLLKIIHKFKRQIITLSVKVSYWAILLIGFMD